MTPAIDAQAVAAFLYREARLADEHRYEEWLALWDDADICYWIPNGRDDPDPHREISITYDDRARLEDRIHRLSGRFAHAQRPQSRMRRLVSNIETTQPSAHLLHVESNFLLAELRHGSQDLFAGRAIHEIRLQADGSWRIAAKKVLLVNNDSFIDNLTFLV